MCVHAHVCVPTCVSHDKAGLPSWSSDNVPETLCPWMVPGPSLAPRPCQRQCWLALCVPVDAVADAATSATAAASPPLPAAAAAAEAAVLTAMTTRKQQPSPRHVRCPPLTEAAATTTRTRMSCSPTCSWARCACEHRRLGRQQKRSRQIAAYLAGSAEDSIAQLIKATPPQISRWMPAGKLANQRYHLPLSLIHI